MDLSSTDLKPESSTSPDSLAPLSRALRPVSSILLAGASVRSLAESAISCGLSPLCVDFFEDFDLKRLLSEGRGRFLGKMETFDQLPAIVESLDGQIPLLWAGGLENHPHVLRELCQQRPLIGANPDLCVKLRDPFQLAEWLSKAGIAAPQLSRTAAADTGRPWLRKLVHSSGGLGISLSESSNGELPNATAGPETHYFQEFIEGLPVSAVLVSDGQTVRLQGMSMQLTGWKSLGASPFYFCGNAGPLELTPSIRGQALKTASVLVRESCLRGVFGLDFILRSGQLWLLEVNPRIPASHVIYEMNEVSESTPQHRTLNGLSLMEQHLAAFGWQPSPQRPVLLKAEIPQQSGTAEQSLAHTIQLRLILWARRSMRIQKMPKLVCSLPGGRCRIADVPSPGTNVIAGSPLCSIHASAESVIELMRFLRGITVKNIPQSDYSWSEISVQLGDLFNHLEAES